jgi:mRNA interferase YafQ
MYEIITSHRFEKDVERCLKRSYKLDLLFKVIELLETEGTLPFNYKPHLLSGKLEGYWECHIRPDWLLLWTKNEKKKTIVLTRTGTHSVIF